MAINQVMYETMMSRKVLKLALFSCSIVNRRNLIVSLILVKGLILIHAAV
jgi:hypothetical protein